MDFYFDISSLSIIRLDLIRAIIVEVISTKVTFVTVVVHLY